MRDPVDEIEGEPEPRWWEVAVLWVVFRWCELVSAVARWWGLRRACAWCRRRLGGNPLARRTTHGMCRPCFGKAMGEVRDGATRMDLMAGEQPDAEVASINQ